VAVQLPPRVPLLVGSLLLTTVLAAYGLRQYQRRGHESALLAFIALMIALSSSLLTETFLRIVTEPGLKLLGFNVLNAIGIWLSSYSFLWFALAYANTTRWLNRWLAGLALAAPLGLTMAVIVAPEFLYAANGLVTQGPMTVLGVTFGEWVSLDRTLKRPFFAVVLGVSAIVLSAIGILGRYLLQHRGDLYTGQAVAVGVGAISPLLAVGLLVAGIVPPELSVTGVAYGVTAVGFAVGIFRYRLLDIAPMGRQQLVAQLTDPVVMLDADGRVVDCNPAARALVSAPAGWHGLSVGDFFGSLSDDIQRILRGPSDGDELSVADGTTTRYFAPDVSTIGADHSPRGRLLVLREITAQKHRERELKRQNERLDQFASTVSHDLQNPLNVAYGHLQRIEDDIDDEQFAAITQAHDRMERLIDDLLTLAQVGQTIEDTDEVALADAATAATGLVDLTDCDVAMAIPATTTVIADADRLVELFENLYRNAVEHTDGAVTLRVGVLSETGSSDTSLHQTGFFVEDTGCGIPESERADIFEHGYTTTTDGTGFGLSIVADIVDAHGWEITVTDSAAGGARFEITGVEFVTDQPVNAEAAP